MNSKKVYFYEKKEKAGLDFKKSSGGSVTYGPVGVARKTLKVKGLTNDSSQGTWILGAVQNQRHLCDFFSFRKM